MTKAKSAKEYRDLSPDELVVQYEDLGAQLFGLRNEQRMTGKLEQPSEVGRVRREIARLLTIMNEKERAQ